MSEPQAACEPVEFGSLTPEATKLMTTADHVRRCCEILRDAALALAHAHERGVDHRDLKPENLLLDRQERVHVIDFGLARFFEDVTLTNTGALVGTPLYISPEQVSGRVGVDHRTDIYSLGVVLYELLTLRRPITASTREDVLRHVVTKALPPVSWLNRAVPCDLESAVHQSTAKDPDERYQSALAFAADLGNVLSNQPVAAKLYRYRFNEKDIEAERPISIIYISFVLMCDAMMAIFVPIPLALLQELNWIQSGQAAVIAYAPFVVFFSFALFVSTDAMLRARLWARLITTILVIIISVSLVFGVGVQLYIFITSDVDPSFIVIVYNIITLIGIALHVMIVQKLYCGRIGRWFAVSKKLRSEYKQQASPR
jgi:hypothetical protein